MSFHNRRRNHKVQKKPDPHYLAAMWPPEHPNVTIAMLQYLWGAIEAGHSNPVRFVGGGDRLQCYANVARQMLQHGGAAVIGWGIVWGAPKLDQRNRLDGYWVDSHCVWQSPQGELLDLTPDYEEARFIANPWGATTNRSCSFFDRKVAVEAKNVAKSLGIDLSKHPSFTPLPPKPLDDQTFATAFIDRRFTHDRGEAAAIRDIFRALLEKGAVTGHEIVMEPEELLEIA